MNINRFKLLFPILLALYEIVTYLSNDAYLPALPHIAHALDTTHHLVQLTLTSWFMGAASIQLFIGPLSDRIGRRPVLLSGGIVFITVTIGCSLTLNIDTLLALRFIQGATIASMVVPGYATVHELFDRKQSIKMIAMMNSMTILAPSLGPLFGAVILHFTNWRWIFGTLAIWAFIVIVGLFFNMPETRSSHKTKIKFTKIIIQYKNILTNKSFMSFTLTAQCLFTGMIAWITAGPFLLIDRFHFHTISFGIAQAFVFGSFIIGTHFVKRLMNLISFKTIVKLAVCLSLLGSTYALGTSIVWPNNIWNMIISMMFLAGGAGLSFPVLNRLAIEESDEPMSSRVAISSFLMGLSGMIGSAIVSQTYNHNLFSLSITLFVLSMAAVFSYRVSNADFDQIETNKKGNSGR
jgi:Bcr/CflA subfamily drug resistance transporter